MRAYVFDIDGTIADGEHRIHHIKKEPPDWRAYFAACVNDTPIEHIVGLIKDLARSDATIVYLTGRSDEIDVETEEWLAELRIPRGPIYMRKADDHRPDYVVKLELLKKIKADGYVPIMVFEDRDRNVRAFREAGVPCAQVAEGNF